MLLIGRGLFLNRFCDAKSEVKMIRKFIFYAILSVPETVTRLDGITEGLVDKFLGGQS